MNRELRITNTYEYANAVLPNPWHLAHWSYSCRAAVFVIRNLSVLFAFTVVLCGSTFAQDSTESIKPKVTFSDIVRINGYIKNLNSISFSDIPFIGNSDNHFLHNRINLRIYPVKNLTIGAEFETDCFMLVR